MTDFGDSYEAAMTEPDAVLCRKASEEEIDSVIDELVGALGQLSRVRTMPTDLSHDGARELSAILSDYEVVPARQLIDSIRGRSACLALETCSNLVGAFRELMDERNHADLIEALESDRAVRLLVRHVLSERAITAPPRRTTLSPSAP